MKLDSNQITKYLNEENILELCKLIPNALIENHPEHVSQLAEAIKEILNIWLYDFSSLKGGDPSTYPFREGLNALETLIQQNTEEQWATYLLYCGQYCEINKDYNKSREYYDKSILLFKQILAKSPQNESVYSKLAHMYIDYPTINSEEKKNKISEVLDLFEKSKTYTNGFYITNVYILYRIKEYYGYDNRVEKLRKDFINASNIKAKNEPLFAVTIASNFFYDFNNKYPSTLLLEEIKNNISYFLEMAIPHIDDIKEGLDLTKAGHTFYDVGKDFEREDFLLTAVKVFKKALNASNSFSLIHVYIAKAKESIAVLLSKKGNDIEAKSLRQEVCNYYIDNWKQNKDISYLSHSIEYLFYFGEMYNSLSEFLKEIELMSLTAERLGQGGYWYPYYFLFEVYLHTGQIDDAKLWLARGYRILNIIIEKDLRKLSISIEKSKNMDIINFLKNIIFHLDRYTDKNISYDNLSYDKLCKMTLEDFDKWLNTDII